MSVARRLRGVLAISLVWGLAWTPFGAALATYNWYRWDHHFSLGVELPRAVAIWAMWGAVNGAIFAIALTIAERSQTLRSLSMRWTGFWGALGGLSLPVVLFGWTVWTEGFAVQSLPSDLAVLGLAAGLGAISALGTLALARRGTARR